MPLLAILTLSCDYQGATPSFQECNTTPLRHCAKLAEQIATERCYTFRYDTNCVAVGPLSQLEHLCFASWEDSVDHSRCLQILANYGLLLCFEQTAPITTGEAMGDVMGNRVGCWDKLRKGCGFVLDLRILRWPSFWCCWFSHQRADHNYAKPWAHIHSAGPRRMLVIRIFRVYINFHGMFQCLELRHLLLVQTPSLRTCCVPERIAQHLSARPSAQLSENCCETSESASVIVQSLCKCSAGARVRITLEEF